MRWLTCAVLAALATTVASAEAGDAKALYAKRATWQESWQAATSALADLEAKEAVERAGQQAPEGIKLGPWHMIGSFSNADHRQFNTVYPPETDIKFDAVYPGMDDSEARWKVGHRLVDGQVIDLHQHFDITEGAIAYFHRVLTADRAMETNLYLGSDDGLAVFLNGERIHANDVPRGPAPDQDVVKAKLQAGDNDLLLKIVNRTGGWGYYFSLKPYAGSGGEAPEHGRRVDELWDMLRRDFSDAQSLREMDWERSDGIWEKSGSPVDDGTLLSRYRGAVGSRTDNAKQLVAWIAVDDSQRSAERLQQAVDKLVAGGQGDSVATARVAYCAARLVSEVMQTQYELSCAGLAINDLATTYPTDYARAGEFRARLRELFGEGERLLSADDPPAGLPGWQSSVADFRRQALVEGNPLIARIDKLLFIRRKGHHGLPQNWHGNASLARMAYDTWISVLSPVAKDPQVSEIIHRQGPFLGDIDLHWSGARFLFSMVEETPQNPYNVYEINVDGSGLRQVTTSPWPDIDNYDGCYLPDGDILFCSTRNFQGVPCTGPDRVGLLYRCNAKGEFVRQLTFDQDHSWHPYVTNDGRILYTRWEYNDTPHYFSRILFCMNPDGTEQMAYYASNSYFPNAIYYTTPIPGSDTQVVCIVSGHHGNPRMGEVAILDVDRGAKGAEGVVQLLPQRHRKPEELIIDQYATGQWPQFLMPYPLSAKYFIVSCQPQAGRPFGIYLVDVFDNLVPIYIEPDANLFEPQPLRARPMPPVVPSRVNYGKQDAVVRLEDIYAGGGLAGVPRGTIKKLRIVEPVYRYWGNGDQYGISQDGTWDVKKIWGTVPVYEDGSALFRVPANTPIAVQPLDGKGMAQQHMRSWFTAMPGEHLACVGCHEPRGHTPPTAHTLATRKGISEIEPWYGEPRPFRFEVEVQPVLDRHCVECHNGQQRVDLRGKSTKPEVKYSVAYTALAPYVRRPGLEADIHMLPPCEFDATTSQLIQLLKKGHKDVKLNAEEWDRLITWIDLNVPYYGDWQEVHQQQAPQDLVVRREEARAADAAARKALAEGRGG
ncbi:MAG: hypothetical protein FJX75_21300 [Armatimonadetes bacterium]|nr:hypothetical protein [Armatimonadota bacterium]